MREPGDPESEGTEVLVVVPDRELGDMDEDELAESLVAGTRPVVLVSSAAVYEPNHHHPGPAAETRLYPLRSGNEITRRWRVLEQAAMDARRPNDAPVVVLRPSAVPLPDARDFFSRLFNRRWTTVLAGHDPSLQLMTPRDLARAVSMAAERNRGGVYNLAPRGVIPLRRALRLAGVRAIPLPRWLHGLTRPVLRSFWKNVHPVSRLDFIRYPWTVCGESAARELGFEPVHDSAQAVAPGSDGETHDDFGLDRRYVRAWSRTVLPFLHSVYWRVEVEGLEHVPRRGPVVLVGIHRGWVPMDAVLVVHDVLRHRGRMPRFLVHPGLLKFPFMFNFITRFGGLIACRGNTDRILREAGVLGVFPEGVRGPFRLYRDAYRLGRFGNDEFLRAALRHGAPIVPFVTVGSAEAFPILGRIQWRWWKRWSEWPFLPVSPTLLPIPLPSKWHTRFLPPMEAAAGLPPGAADEPAAIRGLRSALRETLAKEMSAIRAARPGIFHGSAFRRQDADGVEPR